MESPRGCITRGERSKNEWRTPVRVRHFFVRSKCFLEQTSNAEEELAVSGVTVGVRSLHRAEDSVDNDAQCTVGGEARSLVEGIRRLAVDLRGLVHGKDVNAATQQGR